MKIKTTLHTSCLTLLLSVSGLSLAETSKYTCIDVNMYSVDRDNHSSREMERAAQIPQEILEKIQFITVGEITRSENGLTAMKGTSDNHCTDENSLSLEGTVTDYKKGNRAVRYLVGLGAGKQKIQTDLVLKDKTSGQVIAKKEVVDRKIGGLVGGSEDKGKRDYAEKVDKFIRKALGIKK